MPRVILIRHAMPVLDPTMRPAEWALSDEGRVAARNLAGRLPIRATVLASSERKAQETLHLASGHPAGIDARLNEVRRPDEPIGRHVMAPRRAWVAGCLDARHSAWESPAEAAGRVDQVVREAPEGDVVLGTHGMVLTAWLVSIGFWQPGEPAAQHWATLECPDVVEVTFPEHPTVRPG